MLCNAGSYFLFSIIGTHLKVFDHGYLCGGFSLVESSVKKRAISDLSPARKPEGWQTKIGLDTLHLVL